MTRTQEIRALLLELLRHAEPPRWTGPGPGESLLEEGDEWAEYVKQWVREQRARIDALVPEETEPTPAEKITEHVTTWLSGCSCGPSWAPWQCEECTEAFYRALGRCVAEDPKLAALVRTNDWQQRPTAPPPPADDSHPDTR